MIIQPQTTENKEKKNFATNLHDSISQIFDLCLKDAIWQIEGCYNGATMSISRQEVDEHNVVITNSNQQLVRIEFNPEKAIWRIYAKERY